MNKSASMEKVQQLKEEMQTQPAQGTLWLAAVIFVCWTLIGLSYVYSLIPGWPALILNTLFAYTSFTVLHEAAHGNIRAGKRLKRLERLLGWASGTILTVPFPVFRHLHLTHHAHTNHPQKDPDYWVASGKPLWTALKCASIVPAYYYHFAQGYFHKSPAQKKSYLVRGIMGFSGIYLLSGIVWYHLGWQILIVCWWGPALLATALLALAFNWLPHHPHTSQERYLHTRILNFPILTGPLLGQNYHLIHHLYPGLPFYIYPRVFRLLQADLKSRGSLILGEATSANAESL